MSDPKEPERRGGRNFLIAAIVLIAIVVADQASKAWILTRLGPRGDTNEIKIIPGVLRFVYVENSGAAFGLFQGKSPVLTILAMVVIAFLVVYFRHAIAGSLWLSVALGLQLGGAMGNVADRFRHGFVVDFVNVPKFWTFNVADSAITIGVVMLGLFLVTRDPGPNEEKQQSGQPVSEAPHAEN